MKRLAVALAVLLSVGCSELLTGGYEYGQVTVQITQTTGEPAPNIRVALYSPTRLVASGRTDASGHHTFDLVPLGQFGVYATPLPGFVNPAGEQVFMQGVVVNEGSRDTVAFVLRYATGSIRIVASDASGAPIPGVQLTFSPTEGEAASGVTGLDGEYLFADVPVGKYGVGAEPPDGYVLQPGSVQLPIDGVVVSEDAETIVRLTFVRR